jgi:hypothetical protein
MQRDHDFVLMNDYQRDMHELSEQAAQIIGILKRDADFWKAAFWRAVAAGPIRNARMLEEGKPDIVIAFPGGRGTANMIEQAHAAGVEVVQVG